VSFESRDVTREPGYSIGRLSIAHRAYPLNALRKNCLTLHPRLLSGSVTSGRLNLNLIIRDYSSGDRIADDVSKLYQNPIQLDLLEILNWRKQIPQIVNKTKNRNEGM
jgi:hypothetical protein